MEEVGLGKAENVVRISPLGNFDWNDGVKPGDGQLQDAPKEVIPVTRFRTDRSKSSVDLWGEVSGDEVG